LKRAGKYAESFILSDDKRAAGEGMIMNLSLRRFFLIAIAAGLILGCAPICLAENETAIDWFMKGYDLYNLGRINESLEAYSRSLELDPRDDEAWNNKGIDEGLLGKYDAALYSFQNAVGLNESYAEAWYNMGVIYDLKGYPYTAVQAYKKATQINPDYQKAWERRNVNTDMVMANSLSCACQGQTPVV
jgi:tetratricopeptide (TPR) repeat protein